MRNSGVTWSQESAFRQLTFTLTNAPFWRSRHRTAGILRITDPDSRSGSLRPIFGVRYVSGLLLQLRVATLRFLSPCLPEATHALSAVRSRERRRDEILRRMRHPARGTLPAVRCPQFARSEVLRRVWCSPRA